MTTREVLREQWAAFFQAFTTENVGRLVGIGVNGRHPDHEIVDIEARELPLHEIAVDLKDNENIVVISVGMSSDKLLRHITESVSHVRVVRAEDGSESTIEIESMDGQKTTLSLGVPVSPTA